MLGYRLLAAFVLLPFCVAPCAADPVPLADFARPPQVRDVKISPDGDFLAANGVVKDKALLNVIKLSDLKGINVRGDGDSEVASFAWAGSRQLIYTIGEFEAHREQPYSTGELFVTNADGSNNKLLYGGRRGFGYAAGEWISAFSADSGRALIASFPYTSEDPKIEILKIDLQSAKTELVEKAPLRGAAFLVDNRGNLRVAYGKDADFSEKVYVLESGKWKPAFEGNSDRGQIVPIRFARDDKSVYCNCDGVNHVGGICRWDLQSGTLTTLWSGTESGPVELVSTADDKDVFAVMSTPGRPLVSFIDKETPEAKMLSDLYRLFQGQRVRLGAATRDGTKRVVEVDSDTNPGEFYLYDSPKKKVSKLFTAMPWINQQTLAAMEPIKLSARDGLPLHGYLTRPLGAETARNLPMVVFVHGGPYGVRDEWEFDPDVQMLASRGYAVLQVNFRGSTGYGDAFAEAGLREWGGKMQDDITDATRWAITEGIADAHRICIYGGSYGGYAALQGATKEPDLYRCAIGDSGIYDLPLWTRHTDVRKRTTGKAYMKYVLGEDEAELRDRSPISHLDKLKAKVMLVVGGADERVPPEQGRELHDALNKRKIEHQWIYHRTEGHGVYDVDHRVDMYKTILAFLEENIGNGSAAAGMTKK